MTLIGIALCGFLLIALVGTAAGRIALDVILKGALGLGALIICVIGIVLVIAQNGPSTGPSTFAPAQNEMVTKGERFMTPQEMYGAAPGQ